MIDNGIVEKLVGCVRKVGPVIIGVLNWSILAGVIAAVEIGIPESAIKNAVRGVVYASFLGSAVVGFLSRKKRAKAKIYNNQVCIHDISSGSDTNYEYIARVNIPNILVNPWAVFAPIMADVVQLSKATGTLSCTPKTIKWIAATDGVRRNFDPIGCNEWITGTSAQHLHKVIERLNKGRLTQQQKDMKEGLMRMVEGGLRIE